MDAEPSESGGEVSHGVCHLAQGIVVQQVLLAPVLLSPAVHTELACLLSSDPLLHIACKLASSKVMQ